MIYNKIYKKYNMLVSFTILSVFVFISGVALAATSINQCDNIDSSGDYLLDRDIWSTGNTAVLSCINITSSNVVFDGDSHYIIGNSAAVGTIGVFVNKPGSILTNVTVRNVNVTQWDYGIYLKDTSSSNVTGNNASNNSNGIRIYNSGNNLIFDNHFNNTNNVLIDSSINYWNTTRQPGTNIIGGSYMGGNFWAEPDGNGWSQTCLSNIYGICVSPYDINPGNKDFLPLTNLLPTERRINGHVLDSVTKLGIAGVNVSLDNGNWTITDVNGYYSFVETPGIFNLTATIDDIRYYTNDSVSVSTIDSAVVEQDILLVRKPTGTISGRVSRYSMITISSPENIMYHTAEIPLVVSADKPANSWQYSLNGAANVTFTLPSTVTINAVEGQNSLRVYARDSTGKWDSNSVSFSVDSIPPASVENLQNVSYAIDYINWTWTDPEDADFAHVLVYLDGVPQGEVPKGVMYYNATDLEQATYTIGTRTVDINGTENATIKTHTAATILPVVRHINGTVVEKGTNNGIPGVIVTANSTYSTLTNGTGFYSLALTSGSFSVKASLEPKYYTNSSVLVSTELRAVTRQDIELELKPMGNIIGNVTSV